MNTFAKFKREIGAKVIGCELIDDGCVLHLTAPQGYTWDGDLHEFVAQHRLGFEYPRDHQWMADAIEDLRSRVQEPAVCGHTDCEWCNPIFEEEAA